MSEWYNQPLPADSSKPQGLCENNVRMIQPASACWLLKTTRAMWKQCQNDTTSLCLLTPQNHKGYVKTLSEWCNQPLPADSSKPQGLCENNVRMIQPASACWLLKTTRAMWKHCQNDATSLCLLTPQNHKGYVKTMSEWYNQPLPADSSKPQGLCENTVSHLPGIWCFKSLHILHQDVTWWICQSTEFGTTFRWKLSKLKKKALFCRRILMANLH